MKSITIKQGREESIKRHHPWIFSGAVQKVDSGIKNGETVDIQSTEGIWLARGSFCVHSQIRVRIWTWDADQEIGPDFFKQRFERAWKERRRMAEKEALSAYRWIYGESDGMPGLIVDIYDGFAVCQFLSSGAEFWKEEIAKLLHSWPGVRSVFERSDAEVRLKEGLERKSGLISGEAPPDLIAIREGDLRFWVDIRNGHKTGFYLDQRENRRAVLEFSPGAEVLNAFAYSGGFGLWTLKGGASRVIQVDTSAEALELGTRNAALNNLPLEKMENRAEDVFQCLRRCRNQGQRFDLIILDPPKFVASVAQLKSGARGYKDINLLALQLLRPGGILFTFSCSGHVDPGLFQKIVADAALDAGRELRIIRFLGQAADHPVAAWFPEARYLKGLIGRVGEEKG